MGPNRRDWCPYKKGEVWTQHRGECHMTEEAGLRRPSCLPRKARADSAGGQVSNGPLLEPSEAAQLCPHLDGGLLASRM